MIRRATADDLPRILALYRNVSARPGGIARAPHEVSESYVRHFMDDAARDGIELVFEEEGRILGDIHASRPGLDCFAHLLADLTIAVDPAAQGKGVGRSLFTGLIAHVLHDMPHITRIELFARESNQRARALYESIGFREEGRMPGRIVGADGKPETDTIMGWTRAV